MYVSVVKIRLFALFLEKSLPGIDSNRRLDLLGRYFKAFTLRITARTKPRIIEIIKIQK